MFELRPEAISSSGSFQAIKRARHYSKLLKERFDPSTAKSVSELSPTHGVGGRKRKRDFGSGELLS